MGSRRRGVDINFLPRRRLRFVSERLLGRHPAAVLKEELGDNPHKWVQDQLKSQDGIETIIAGREDEARAEIYQRSGMLSPLEQADCLVRQATDPNVLGRAYEGWAPEI